MARRLRLSAACLAGRCRERRRQPVRGLASRATPLAVPLHAESGNGQRMPSFRFAADSALEGAGFEPSVPRKESRRFEPASIPSRVGRCRRGGYGPGGDCRPDRAVEIADRRWCASEPPLEVRIKRSRRVGPSRGTDGSNPSPSSEESANHRSRLNARPEILSADGATLGYADNIIEEEDEPNPTNRRGGPIADKAQSS